MIEVVCSGLSGDDDVPSGVAVARSLRSGVENVTLVGLAEHSDVPGAHDPVFDAVIIGDLEPLLAGSGEATLWISGNDLDVARLARTMHHRSRVLSPAQAALDAIRLPARDVARDLDIKALPTVSMQHDDWELCAFAREHGWRVWLKGPHGRAVQLDSWRSLVRTRAAVVDDPRDWLLQPHIPGSREAIAFAAFGGRLLGVQHLYEGDACDTVADPPPALVAGLGEVLARLGWTGGGTFELVRDRHDALWLAVTRPHFPGWIGAAAQANVNLPAALLAAATGATVPTTPRGAGERIDFVRVVTHVPRRADLTGTKPSRRALRPSRRCREAVTDPPSAFQPALNELADAVCTPFAHELPPGSRWTEIAQRLGAASSSSCRVRGAYSVKTDPRPELLVAARAHGFLAEAISGHEVAAAQRAGFTDAEVVLNGPAKRWPSSTAIPGAFAVFADSTIELAALPRTSGFVGPRLRVPSHSRFGVALDDPDVVDEVVASISRIAAEQAIGVHFHRACSEHGHADWFATLANAVAWARTLEQRAARPIRCLDLGGGWFPDDFERVLLARLPRLVVDLRRELTSLEVIVLEPGKALAQPLAMVEATVLEMRERAGVRDVVIDASIAEIPEAHEYPHRVMSRDQDGWRLWGRGPDNVLGRLAMEIDVIAFDVAAPDDLRRGDRVLIADAGAYDRSMAYSFGLGSQ